MSEIPVNKDVLVWAREECALSVEQAVERLTGIGEDELRAYESGKKKPTLTAIRKLGTAYNLPVATLVMPKPLPKSTRPKDYRTVDGRPESISFNTALAIRQARQYQSIAEEVIAEEPDLAIPVDIRKVSIESDPDLIAAAERAKIGIDIEQQIKWSGEDEAFRKWRDVIEGLGIFVYVLDFPIGDCRGFSLYENSNPAIVISKNEYTYGARTFSLFHEYCHILLDCPGLSNQNNQNRYERFCNRFAASFLMPKKDLIKYLSLPSEPEEMEWDVDQIKDGARKFSISQQSFALRLEELGYAKAGFYTWFANSQPKNQGKEQKGGFVQPTVKRLMEVGGHFASNVLTSLDRGNINVVEAYKMLDLRPKNFDSLRSKLERRKLYHGPNRTVRT